MQPYVVSEIASAEELRFGLVPIDMDEIELFLTICRKVIDKGRNSMKRLTKIEANLRELRLKYASKNSAQGTQQMQQDGDMDLDDFNIKIEDLFFSKEADPESYVHQHRSQAYPTTHTVFKTTAQLAK